MASAPPPSSSSLGGYLGGLGGTLNRLGQEIDVGLQQAALNLGQAIRGASAAQEAQQTAEVLNRKQSRELSELRCSFIRVISTFCLRHVEGGSVCCAARRT